MTSLKMYKLLANNSPIIRLKILSLILIAYSASLNIPFRMRDSKNSMKSFAKCKSTQLPYHLSSQKGSIRKIRI